MNQIFFVQKFPFKAWAPWRPLSMPLYQSN